MRKAAGPGLLAGPFTLAKLALIWVMARPFGGLSALCKWDCNWYVSIAGDGYQAAPILVAGGDPQANWAFFPAYPALVRLADLLSGQAPRAGVIIASAGCTIGLAVAGGLYLRRTRPGVDPCRWALLLVAWPYAFYFDIGYAESLYGLVLVLGLLAWRARLPVASAALASVLMVTRPTGILLGAWIAAGLLLGALRHRPGLGRAERLAEATLPLAILPICLVAFMGWLAWRTGDGLAFLHVKTGWGHELCNPVSVLREAISASRGTWRGLLDPGFWQSDPPSYRLAFVALAGLAALWLAWRRRMLETWLCAGPVVLVLASGVTAGMPRYVAANPVFLFALADLLAPLSWPVVAALLCAGFGMQLLLVIAWLQNAQFLL